jgi:acyl carrier protein
VGSRADKDVRCEFMDEKIILSIKSVFENFDENQFSHDMLLEDIPDWDSMNSVNFQAELELAFDVDMSDEVLSGDMKISDVVDILDKRELVNS